MDKMYSGMNENDFKTVISVGHLHPQERCVRFSTMYTMFIYSRNFF
jgi:hypothetical protein